LTHLEPAPPWKSYAGSPLQHSAQIEKKLALLDSTSIWLFENFKGDKFFSGDVSKIDLGIVTQKEAITFYDDNTIAFTDEEFKGIGGNVYFLKLDQVTKVKVQRSHAQAQ
jgi:hypothetical protein